MVNGQLALSYSLARDLWAKGFPFRLGIPDSGYYDLDDICRSAPIPSLTELLEQTKGKHLFIKYDERWGWAAWSESGLTTAMHYASLPEALARLWLKLKEKKGLKGGEMSNTRLKQLLQIFNGATWDGNLISKYDRDSLVKASLVKRAEYGYNIITPKGVEYVIELGLVRKG